MVRVVDVWREVLWVSIESVVMNVWGLCREEENGVPLLWSVGVVGDKGDGVEGGDWWRWWKKNRYAGAA